MSKHFVLGAILGVSATLPLIPAISLGEEKEAAPPLAVGSLVPISSMHCVVGEPRDGNTCFAGKYRDRRAISIYAHTADEARLAELCRKINSLVAADPESRGYILFFDGRRLDDAYKGRMRDWSKEHSLDKLDMATSQGNAKRYGVAPETGVTIVFSDKRQISYRRDIPVGRIDQAAIDDVAKQLTELMSVKKNDAAAP